MINQIHKKTTCYQVVFLCGNLANEYLCCFSSKRLFHSTMQDYVINVSQIEELQTLNDRSALDNIFERALRVVVGGGTIILVRQSSNGQREKFDSFSTEGDLAAYKKNVYKYLS
jgi:hypothetical protein